MAEKQRFTNGEELEPTETRVEHVLEELKYLFRRVMSGTPRGRAPREITLSRPVDRALDRLTVEQVRICAEIEGTKFAIRCEFLTDPLKTEAAGKEFIHTMSQNLFKAQAEKEE